MTQDGLEKIKVAVTLIGLLDSASRGALVSLDRTSFDAIATALRALEGVAAGTHRIIKIPKDYGYMLVKLDEQRKKPATLSGSGPVNDGEAVSGRFLYGVCPQ